MADDPRAVVADDPPGPEATGPTEAGLAKLAARLAPGLPRHIRRAGDFDTAYDTTPPWDIDRPQPVILALAESGQIEGRVLDVGCGTGEHALMAASRGLEATGIDAAAVAIEKAQAKAEERGLAARFLLGDVLDLGKLGEQYDSVIDSGVFHVFEDADRRRYVDSLTAAVRPGGRYFMMCFSTEQPGDWGPRRVSEGEIRAAFEHGWTVDRIEPSRFVLTFFPDGVYAWLVVLTRS